LEDIIELQVAFDAVVSVVPACLLVFDLLLLPPQLLCSVAPARSVDAPRASKARTARLSLNLVRKVRADLR
jgi:hypothetical protein